MTQAIAHEATWGLEFTLCYIWGLTKRTNRGHLPDQFAALLEPSGTRVDAALRLVGRRVPHKAGPLAPGSFVGLGWVGRAPPLWLVIKVMARFNVSPGATVIALRVITSNTAMESARSPCCEMACTISRSEMRPPIASALFTIKAAIPRACINCVAVLTVAVGSIVKTSAPLRSRIF
jgi:hypothetical protein